MPSPPTVPPLVELPFLQLSKGSSSFLIGTQSTTEQSTTKNEVNLIKRTTTTIVTADEENFNLDSSKAVQTKTTTTTTSSLLEVSNDVDFDDLNDFNDDFLTDENLKLTNTPLLTQKSLPSVDVKEVTTKKIDQQTSQLEEEDIINFIPESQQEIRYHNKQIKLSNGKSFTLRKKHKPLKPLLNTLELSREESYGLNINNLYTKLEKERLRVKTKNTDGKSYLSNLKVKKTEQGNPKKDTLWVEKWRPTKYMDFIGNEQTNRKIVHWFKQWDRVVFEKNFKPITENDQSKPSSISSSYSSSGKSFSKHYHDPFGRPDRKVLLISGAPGLGKTTISHIIAKMCGYEVMEINASDERSGQRIRDKVTNSLSSLTFSGKPVCLIADEVDGAAEFGFVKVILDILADDKKTVHRFQRAGDSNKFFKEKGKNSPKFLLRPIVAICNDVYAPALEKLRSQCEMVGFKQASEKSLIDRLKFICNAERLVVSGLKLKEIVTLTDYDIRSCLNLLQFSGADLNDSRQKDMTVSWYNIVSQLFQKDSRASKAEQFKRLNSMISINGNFDKIIHGCFQTYISMHYQDLKLTKPCKISDWLYFSDLMSKTQFDTTAGDISSYAMETALQFHELFSDLSNKSNMKIKSDYEHFEMKKNNMNIIKLLFNNTPAQLRTMIKLQTLPTDILPFLPYVLTPDLSKIHIPQYQSQNQHKSTSAIDALNAFKLQILKSKDDDNYNLIYKTYPDFTPLTKFNIGDIKRQYNKQTNSFPVLLNEIDRLRVLKRKHGKSSSSVSVSKSGKASNEESEDDGDDVGETSFQILKNQYEKIAEQEQKAKRQKRETVAAEGLADFEVKVWVKYHEGFSNAVRKRVRWNDLFG